ncbi:MAG: hypothetical protein ACLQUY_18440 [Ktedonobacterales bacterium]
MGIWEPSFQHPYTSHGVCWTHHTPPTPFPQQPGDARLPSLPELTGAYPSALMNAASSSAWRSSNSGSRDLAAPPEQLDQWQAEERALAVSRKRFGEIARKELGVEAVNLFVSTELGVPPTGASQSADNKMP